MGQKVHPTSLRLGIIKTWNSTWYSEKDYAKWLHEDIGIRRFIKTRYKDAAPCRSRPSTCSDSWCPRA